MENKISILFSNLLITTQDIKNCLIELNYENKSETIVYPKINPLILTLSQKSDRPIITINIKQKQTLKKKKILAYGELIIIKKILLEKPIEKYIFLFPKEKENDRVKSNKDNIGKIFIQIKLDNSKNNKNEFKIPKLDNSNKKEKETKDIFFDDNILDIKANPFDKNDIKLYNINDIISHEMINKLKEIINNEEMQNNLLSMDINSLKLFNENLLKEYKDLNENYFNILSNISKNNEELKQKAKKYLNDNIQLEDELYKLRKESKENKDKLQQTIIENNEKINNISKNIEDINIKQKNILENIDINKNDNNNKENNNYGDDNDIKNICKLIKQLNSLGYNIDNGDITDSEKQNLNDLLKDIDNISNNNELQNNDNNNLEQNELIKEDLEYGNTIVSLIERDVNDLYKRNLIEQVKIDQIDSINYIFTGEKNEKNVTFKIENNNLICSNGETFTVWLIKNFSL